MSSSLPYLVTTWAGGYHDQARFRRFEDALAFYQQLKCDTKQLVNTERAEDGRDGLTLEEREQL